MPELMFPDSRSTGGHDEAVVRDRPPELRGGRTLWTCRHIHYGHGDAVLCAVEEIRRRWVLQVLGVPEGWDVHAVLQSGVGGHRGQMHCFIVDAPDRPGYHTSAYRFYTGGAALTRGAAWAVERAKHEGATGRG